MNILDQSSILRRDIKYTIFNSLFVAFLVALTVYLTGRVSSFEARELLETLMPSIRFLTSAIMTVTATILTLMLTLISFSYGAEFELQGTFYQRVRIAALFTTITFVFATALLALSSVPIGESENVPSTWYTYIYYSAVILSSLLAGVLISIVIMLYYALRNMISIIRPDEDEAQSSQSQSLS